MKLKPKAARRLLLLAVATCLVIAGLFAVVVVRKWQNERRAQRLRTEGMAAYERADYPVTLDNLGGYLRRKAEDREAWLAFADAREKLEEAGGRNIVQAAKAFERAWVLDESDIATARRLLSIYNLAGFYVEARDLAVRLRPADVGAATDTQVLLEEAVARVELKSFDGILDALTDRLITIDKSNYRALLLRLDYLIGAGRKDEAVAFAKSLVDRSPGDPRFEVVRQITLRRAGQVAVDSQLAAAACRAAGLDAEKAARLAVPAYDDVQFAGQLVNVFDSVRMYSHSVLVLEDAATRLHDSDSRRVWARRLWQETHPAGFLKRFPPPEADAPVERSEIRAFRALSLYELGRRDEAIAVLTELRARTRDFAARAWSAALTAVLETDDPKQALEHIASAMKEDPYEPTFLFLRGEYLRRLGRGDDAREVWNNVYRIRGTANWAMPAVRIAESLLDEGRVEEGGGAARAAVNEWNRSAAAAAVWIRAHALAIEAGNKIDDPAVALKQLEEKLAILEAGGDAAVRTQSRRLLLPAKASLLVSVGRTQDARLLVEQMLADRELLDTDLAQRLAALSMRTGMKLEDKILAAVSQGETGTSALISRALLLETTGGRDEALRLFESELASAPAESKLDVMWSKAKFLDVIRHPDALKAWKATTEAYPASLPLHLEAIRSNAPIADLAYVEELTTRITALGGSDADRPSADVRLAKARALLFGTPDARAYNEAVGILRALVIAVPSRTDVRSTLADALLLEDHARQISPDFRGAIEQLTALAATAKDRAPYVLRIASILQREGKSDEAASQLGNLALDGNADPLSRLKAVDRLAGLAEYESALLGIDSLIAMNDSPGADMLMRRASLLTSLRRDREAADTYRRVLRMPVTDPNVLVALAVACRSLGDTAGADAAIAKLDAPEITPSDRALARATYAARGGELSQALAEFQAATQASPGDPKTWLALARFYLGRGEFVPASDAARKGLEQSAGNAELEVVLQQASLGGQSESSADLTPLADALARNPATARRAEAVRAVATAQKEGKLDDAAAITALADEFADDSTMQLFAARRLAALKPPRMAEANRVISRASTRFPTDTAIQEQATRQLIAAADWQPALAAATNWRSLARRPEADLAVAEAQLALGQVRQALESVRDYRLPAAIDDGDSVALGVLNIRVRAAVLNADLAGGSKLLQPYLSKSASVRRFIALSAAASLIPDAGEIRRWIELVAANSAGDSVDEQLAIARAWAAAGERLPKVKDEFLKKAVAVTDPLIGSEATATAQVFEARALFFRGSGDLKSAVAAARLAVEKDPTSERAMISLASLLLDAEGGAAEAATVSRRVLELNPASADAMYFLAGSLARQISSLPTSTASAAIDDLRGQFAETASKFAAVVGLDWRALYEMAMLAEEADHPPSKMDLYEKSLAAAQGATPVEIAVLNNNLAWVLYTQAIGSGKKDALARAQQLASKATEASPNASFFDTLGCINAALSDRAGAVAAFRKSLSIDPQYLEASVGLASQLAAGSGEEKTEAAELLKAIDARLAKGEKISDQRKAMLEAAKAGIAG